MALVPALRWLEILTGLALALQTAEFLALRPALGDSGVWAIALTREDLDGFPAPLRRCLVFLARDDRLLAHLLLRLAASVALGLTGASLPLILFLAVGSLIIQLRWRGAFNGGSDFMTLVLLSGLLIDRVLTALGHPDLGGRAGLLYVAIQALTSYVISGGVKLLQRDWRSGRALPLFLDAGLYGPLPRASRFWRPRVAALCSYGFILWECAFPLCLLGPAVAVCFCAAGLVFHFLVFWFLGLNRFFFAWIASYPAILYASTYGRLVP